MTVPNQCAGTGFHTYTHASTPSSSPPLVSAGLYAPLQQPQPHSEDRSPHCSRLMFVAVLQLCASAHSRSHPLEPRLWSLALAQSQESGRGRRSRPWTACRRGYPSMSRRLGLRVGGVIGCGDLAEAERRRSASSRGGGVAVRAVYRGLPRTWFLGRGSRWMECLRREERHHCERTLDHYCQRCMFASSCLVRLCVMFDAGCLTGARARTLAGAPHVRPCFLHDEGCVSPPSRTKISPTTTRAPVSMHISPPSRRKSDTSFLRERDKG